MYKTLNVLLFRVSVYLLCTLHIIDCFASDLLSTEQAYAFHTVQSASYIPFWIIMFIGGISMLVVSGYVQRESLKKSLAQAGFSLSIASFIIILIAGILNVIFHEIRQHKAITMNNRHYDSYCFDNIKKIITSHPDLLYTVLDKRYQLKSTETADTYNLH